MQPQTDWAHHLTILQLKVICVGQLGLLGYADLSVEVYLFRQEQTVHYTHNTKITITMAGNQKGNAHRAGHLWHKQENNHLMIC